MSCFSSLELVHPGYPPEVTVDALRRFSEALAVAVGVKEESECKIRLKFGRSVEQDDIDTGEMMYRKFFGVAFGSPKEFEWDLESEGWPDSLDWAASVYRARVGGGLWWLKKAVAERLQMYDGSTDHSYFVPDSLSVTINPFRPSLLEDDEPREPTGFLSVGFSGNGYFTWQDLGVYARHYHHAHAVVAAQRICREFFSVPEDGRYEAVEKSLGSLCLNREHRQCGDWVLTIRETG